MQVSPELLKIQGRGGYIHIELYRGMSDRGIIYMHGVGDGTHGPSHIYHPLAEDLLQSCIGPY